MGKKVNARQAQIISGELTPMFKFLSIGDSGAGKTCLLQRYTDDVFAFQHISTIGVEFKMKTVQISPESIPDFQLREKGVTVKL